MGKHRSHRPKDPSSLTRGELAAIVKRIQAELWLDTRSPQTVWDAHKEWDEETLEEIALHLDVFGLRPEE